MRSSSIRARFTGWYLAVLTLLLSLLSVGLYLAVNLTLRRDLDRGLVHRAQQLIATRDIQRALSEGRFEGELEELVAFYTRTESGYDIVPTWPGESLVGEPSIDAALAGVPSFTTATTARGQIVRLYITPFRPPGASLLPNAADRPSTALDDTPEQPPRASAVLVVGRPMDIVTSALGALRSTLLSAVPLTLLLSALGGLFLVRRALVPVDRMIETAQEIGESDLQKRIEVSSKDELGRLATTLNGMLSRLEEAFLRQRQFTDDASHELRSPLSVIEAEASLALRRERTAEDYRGALGTILEETSKLTRLIDQLLTLARGDAAPDPFPQENVDLAAVARDTVGVMRPLAEEAGVHLDIDAQHPAPMRGRASDLRRLLTNLMDNAIRHTPRGGDVQIRVRHAGATVTLAVMDTGTGIPAEHLPRIFDRFYRVDHARSNGRGGRGLGLAISKQIVEAHGGTIAVDSRPNDGTRFVVRFPVDTSAE